MRIEGTRPQGGGGGGGESEEAREGLKESKERGSFKRVKREESEEAREDLKE